MPSVSPKDAKLSILEFAHGMIGILEFFEQVEGGAPVGRAAKNAYRAYRKSKRGIIRRLPTKKKTNVIDVDGFEKP